MLLTKAKELLFDILFPPLCIVCGESVYPAGPELYRGKPGRRVKEVDYTPSTSSGQVLRTSSGQVHPLTYPQGTLSTNTIPHEANKVTKKQNPMVSLESSRSPDELGVPMQHRDPSGRPARHSHTETNSNNSSSKEIIDDSYRQHQQTLAGGEAVGVRRWSERTTIFKDNIGNKYLCNLCAKTITLNSTLFCPVCRARLAENRHICSHATYFLAAAGDYQNAALKKLIHALKYQNLSSLTPTLGSIMARYFNNVSKIENCAPFETSVKEGKLKIENCIAVPIPLHPRRERSRGFNQAKLLAEELKKYFALPIEEPLIRTKYTAPQMELRDTERRKENVKNCFAVKANADLYGKTILLVDDVFTSGSTMKEAVSTLKTHGAKRIIATVLAKT